MRQSIIQWFKFASPQSFYPLAGRMIPWFWAAAGIFGIAGLWISFFVAPTDATQGQVYRMAGSQSAYLLRVGVQGAAIG